jgi:hypothetical protein
MSVLILKGAPASRPSGGLDDDDDVLADGVVVGRIMKMQVAPRAKPWFWGIGHSHLKGRSPPTYGYEATREAAMAAFAKSWRWAGVLWMMKNAPQGVRPRGAQELTGNHRHRHR